MIFLAGQNQPHPQNENNQQPQWPAFFPPFPGQQPNAPQVSSEGQTGADDSSANSRNDITNDASGNMRVNL